jgi:hypothetical protein
MPLNKALIFFIRMRFNGLKPFNIAYDVSKTSDYPVLIYKSYDDA